MLKRLDSGVATSNPIPPSPACESMPTLENGRKGRGIAGLYAGSAAKGVNAESPVSTLSTVSGTAGTDPGFSAEKCFKTPDTARLCERPLLPERSRMKMSALDGYVRGLVSGFHPLAGFAVAMAALIARPVLRFARYRQNVVVARIAGRPAGW